MRILLLLVLTIINLLRALVLNIECTGLCYFLNSCQRHRSIRILNEKIMITSTKFQMIRLYDYWSNFQGKWKRLDLRTIYGLPIGLGLHAAAATWSRVFYLWWPSWDLTVPGGGNWLLMQTFNQSIAKRISLTLIEHHLNDLRRPDRDRDLFYYGYKTKWWYSSTKWDHTCVLHDEFVHCFISSKSSRRFAVAH